VNQVILALDKAVALGYEKWSKLKKDQALAPMHSEAKFQDWVAAQSARQKYRSIAGARAEATRGTNLNP
jgi:hypothetical protein